MLMCRCASAACFQYPDPTLSLSLSVCVCVCVCVCVHRYSMILNILNVEGADPLALLQKSFKQFQVHTHTHMDPYMRTLAKPLTCTLTCIHSFGTQEGVRMSVSKACGRKQCLCVCVCDRLSVLCPSSRPRYRVLNRREMLWR